MAFIGRFEWFCLLCLGVFVQGFLLLRLVFSIVSCVSCFSVESIFARGLWLIVIYSRWFTVFGDRVEGFSVSSIGCGFLGDSPDIR